MRFGRHYRDHTRIARDVVPLDPRDPSLITLPLSVPSIPIVGAVLTQIVGGTNQAATTTSSSTSTPDSGGTTTPATVTPAPTSTASSSNGDGSDTDSSSTIADGSGGSTSTGDSTGSTNTASGTSTGKSSPQPSGGSGNGQSGSGNNGSNDDGSSTNNNYTSSSSPGANAGGSANSVSGSGSDSGADGNGNSGSTSYQSTDSSGTPGSTSSSGTNGAITTGNSSVSNSDGGMSSGAIAGIVVVLVLILLVIAVIVFRRRHINRRTERLNSWWAIAGSRSSREGGESPHSNRSRNSVRSSFATTVDHAQTSHLRMSFGDAPPLPPMAEIRGDDNAGPFQPFSPNSALADSPVLITFDNSHPSPIVAKKRASTHSVASNGSGAQYLIVPGMNTDGQEVTTPMSVRPFSPSESFLFPKPPKEQSGGDLSRRLSSTTSRSGATVYAISSDPFSDPAPLPAQFSAIESVYRPFVSTRHDELSVAVADRVKVIRLFDDGWALVEKLLAFDDIVGTEGQNMHGAQGLIPIDCFRAEGQDLTTFLIEKRVASNLYDSAYAGATV
ncbi:hypothetical protein H0H92_001910 [Tricholoma furcatifolium]|nr:hypothetical protein H0H92_001910 [Tricholoma furcatifolium]